jgi:cell division transport system permease protein
VTRAIAILTSLLRSGLHGLRSSPVTSTVAIVTISVALVLAGGFALLVTNMGGVLQRFGEELQVVAYLEEGVDERAAQTLVERAGTVEGVASVRLVTKEEALRRFRETTGGGALLDGLDANPLPASIELAIEEDSRTPEGLQIVVSSLSGLPGVAELAHGQEWVEGYARFVALVRAAAVGLGLVLGIAALMIVANTIRLAVYAREDEIEIMALVGASRSYVRIPFLIEGTLQGAIGGALAVGLLYGGYVLALPRLEYGLELVMGNVSPHFFGASGSFAVVAAGGGLGLLGSIMALVGWRSAS